MGTRSAPGPRRRKLYITRLRPKGRKLVYSAAPPLSGETALLGFAGGRLCAEEQKQFAKAREKKDACERGELTLEEFQAWLKRS